MRYQMRVHYSKILHCSTILKLIVFERTRFEMFENLLNVRGDTCYVLSEVVTEEIGFTKNRAQKRNGKSEIGLYWRFQVQQCYGTVYFIVFPVGKSFGGEATRICCVVCCRFTGLVSKRHRHARTTRNRAVNNVISSSKKKKNLCTASADGMTLLCFLISFGMNSGSD